MKVNVQYAETHLADLISAADNGEIVEIARPDKSTLRLVVDNEPARAEMASQGRRSFLGGWEGRFTLPSDDEWHAMDKEIEDEMLNGDIAQFENR